MSQALAHVRRSARRARKARVEYRAAVVAARTEGATIVELADAAEVSRQAIEDLLRRAAA